MRRAAIIRNPNGASVPSLSVLLDAARAVDGWDVSILETERPGHAETLAREAALDGAMVVFACGGDGTANEVANGLSGSSVALALIRGGLTNALANEMEVPEDPLEAVGLLATGEIRQIDVGLVNSRRFLLMAGIGLDAAVIRSVSPRAKRILGKLPFVFRGIEALIMDQATHAVLRIDGKPMDVELFWLLLTNLRSYAGIPTTKDAAVNDGLLDCFLLEGEGPQKTLPAAARILASGVGRPDDVHVRHVRRVEVLTPGLPMHADGESIGDTPASFGVEQRGLSVLLPPSGIQKLFDSP